MRATPIRVKRCKGNETKTPTRGMVDGAGTVRGSGCAGLCAEAGCPCGSESPGQCGAKGAEAAGKTAAAPATETIAESGTGGDEARIRNVNRPPDAHANRPGTEARPNNNPNRPPSAYTPPPRRFNELSPQDRQRVLEYNRRLQSLPPAQRQELQDRARVWSQMSPAAA